MAQGIITVADLRHLATILNYSTEQYRDDGDMTYFAVAFNTALDDLAVIVADNGTPEGIMEEFVDVVCDRATKASIAYTKEVDKARMFSSQEDWDRYDRESLPLGFAAVATTAVARTVLSNYEPILSPEAIIKLKTIPQYPLLPANIPSRH